MQLFNGDRRIVHLVGSELWIGRNGWKPSHNFTQRLPLCWNLPKMFFFCVWNWYKMSFASRKRFSSNSHGKVWKSKWPLSIQQTLANQQNPNSSHTAGSSGQNRTRKWRLLRQQSQEFSVRTQSTFMMTGVFLLSHIYSIRVWLLSALVTN